MAFDDLFDDLVPKGTVRFTLDAIFVRCDKPLVLIMKHAGESNPAYKSGRLKMVSELRARSGQEIDVAALIKLFAHTVITGWENVNDGGVAVPFTPTQCIELLMVIAKKAPDEINLAFAYARDASNFRGPIAAAADTLGK